MIQDGEVRSSTSSRGGSWKRAPLVGGLHQAIEAKERVRIKENITLATITLQNYFGYDKLAGTQRARRRPRRNCGRNLNVVEIPTSVAVARDDRNDFIFKTKEASSTPWSVSIVERHEAGQPVLVGTIDVETSSTSQMLERHGVRATS